MSLITSRTNAFAFVVLLALVGSCKRSMSMDGEVLDSEPAARESVQLAEAASPTEAGKRTLAEHHRCEKHWEAHEYSAVLEKHDGVNWFCSPWIELETP
jgi:hypothetical protein